MNATRQAICLVACFFTQAAWSDHHDNQNHHYDEEIVVTAPFSKTTAETVLPVNVLSGEQLQREITSTLGDTLNSQLGVHNSSFGPGVGLPVIRGQSGTRVQVLQNGVNTADVSTLSPDHANGVEPALAERIEVVRGPATLLYGNGAIGGVVNVIDGRIPEGSFDQTEFMIEQTHETASDENKTVFKLNTSIGGLNLHIDGFTRESDDIEIDGYAIDEAALAELEELHGHDEDEHHDDDEEHHDEDEEEHHDEDEEGHHDDEEIVNSNGFIANTDTKSDGGTIGLSFSNDRGFIGFSSSVINNEYGLPPGSHSHGDEGHHDDEDEHHDEDDEEHHDEDEEEHHDDEEEEGHDEDEHEHEEEGQEFVRVDMEQVRHDFRAGLNLDGWIQQVRADISYTDYEHQEIEIEPDGVEVLGTQFESSGIESRFTMTHAPMGGWNGVIGLQYTDTEFEAIGAEAFIPQTDENGLALFLVERLETDNATWEVGARVENTDLDPASCDESETTFSASVSGIFNIADDSNVLVAVSRSERAPSIEERYSNVDLSNCTGLPEARQVLHAATSIYEVGNPNLDTETAYNIEVGYRRFAGAWTAEVSAYYNAISDYIYLDLFEEDRGNYVSEDATFWGVEGKVTIPFYDGEAGRTSLSFQGDYVRADFDDAGDVPRIPPARVGLHISHFANKWSFDIGLSHAFEQDHTGDFETETDHYTDLEVYADYHWTLSRDAELRLFLKGTNLLDEEIRNHSSFLKNYAPEAGLGARLGLRLTY